MAGQLFETPDPDAGASLADRAAAIAAAAARRNPPRIGHAGQNPPRHRNTDPRTSQAAADSLSARGVGARCRRYYEVIVATGPDGATRDDIARLVDAQGAEDRALSRRITDLRQQGLVVDSGRTRRGSSGREQVVWVAVGADREAV